MFHYIHPRPNTDFTYRPQALSPRDKYLVAIAQAKAAEAEYLVAEAAQQEEAALRRRLHEIQLQKQRLDFPSSSYPYQTTTSFGNPYYQGGPNPVYEFLEYARQIEEEEIRRRVIEERAQARHLAEKQVCLRLQADQEERSRASAAVHWVESERKARRKLQAETDTIILALNRQAEKEQAALAQSQRSSVHPQSNKWGPQHVCHIRRQSNHSEQATEVPFHSFLKTIIGWDALASAAPQQKSAAEAFDINQLLGTRQDSGSKPINVDHILKSLYGVDLEQQQATPPKSHASAPQSTSIEDILKHFLIANQAGHRGQATVPPKPTSTPSNPETDTLKQIWDLFLGGGQHTTEAPKSPQAPSASSSSSKPNPAPAETSQANVQDLSQIFNIIFGQAAPQDQQQKATPSEAPAASDVPKPDVMSAEASLKAQLEARLGNEYASEVRDTIQAILASLQDVTSAGTPPAPSASSPVSSSKGKAKAAEPSSSSVPLNAGATSQDVSKAFDEVRNIEATFHLLASEFAFPSQLDFLTPAKSTPASLDRESIPSSITHLSYTSRNNPVRHYEQSLGALMSQLDAVESFGNETLRTVRKEVVGRVGRALEELEREVEGRWKARMAKEIKSREPMAAEAESVTAFLAPEPTPAEGKNTPTEVAAPYTEPTSPAPESNPAETMNKSPEVVASKTVEATEAAQETTAEPAVEAKGSTSPSPTDITTENIARQSKSNEETISEATSANELSLTPTSLDTSVATIKPYDVTPVETDEIDTFLIPASTTPDVKAKPEVRDNDVGDAGSDWSEVEA